MGIINVWEHTWNTNSNAPFGIGTGFVSQSVPEIAIQLFAEVVAALAFRLGNITTLYGNFVVG